MEKAKFITIGSITLSCLGVLFFTYDYLFLVDDYPQFLIIRIACAIPLIIFILFQYYANEEIKKTFLNYLMIFAVIFYGSLLVNTSYSYIIYNIVDEDYKYEFEEALFQKTYNRRIERGLPVPVKLRDEEIEEKYSFFGLINLEGASYSLNIIFVLLFYPVGVLIKLVRENYYSDRQGTR